MIANESNILTHSLVLASALLGKIITSVRRRFKKQNEEHVRILNKLNSKRQSDFNLKNLNQCNAKVESERKNGGLIIKAAFFGEFNKTLYIYKSLNLFGNYLNEDSQVFDVKVPLMCHLVNSKIEIPKNFMEIEGIYIPDYSNRDSLGLVILYTYNCDDYTVILKNDRSEFSLP